MKDELELKKPIRGANCSSKYMCLKKKKKI